MLAFAAVFAREGLLGRGSRQLFEVFHDGHWLGETEPPPPTWYIVTPALNDTREIVDWKIRELNLPLRKPGEPGRGIPPVGKRVEHWMLTTTYSKREVANFLSALNIPHSYYDFKSTQVFRPKQGYELGCLRTLHLSRITYFDGLPIIAFDGLPTSAPLSP